MTQAGLDTQCRFAEVQRFEMTGNVSTESFVQHCREQKLSRPTPPEMWYTKSVYMTTSLALPRNLLLQTSVNTFSTPKHSQLTLHHHGSMLPLLPHALLLLLRRQRRLHTISIRPWLPNTKNQPLRTQPLPRTTKRRTSRSPSTPPRPRSSRSSTPLRRALGCPS